jgi:transglutaminase-like putative cysteine protease
LIACTEQLMPREGDAAQALKWRQLAPGQLLVIREGAVIAERSAGGALVTPRTQRLPARAEPRTFDVVHRTVYRYEKAIERSMHVLRLTPVNDHRQTVLSHELVVSVPGQTRDYDDVFGNRVRRISIETPFTELAIEARSTVALNDVDPIGVGPLRVSQTIPLVWMPWQRQILDPFLLPPELPETELAELADYAMSFVKRNDFDLLDTLLDINETINGEYAYIQGATTVFTTAFEVYVNRRGVCQDFTNLMICLARLLGVPARYACGYIYTHSHHVQSEASHAWVQVYLPQLGWKGFDPTNGILTQTDHVRVAVGRNYLDATPTSGTIFVGGGGETLSVDVKVTPHTR